MNKKEVFLLLILLMAAFFLRVQGISFGLPYRYHCDEPVTVNVAVGFGSGDLNPHYFAHPTLLHYILFILYGLYFILAKSFGIFQSLAEFRNLFFLNPTYFYLIGRMLGVLFGTSTIFLLYLIGKKYYNKTVGFISAIFLTFNFLHARSSHYVRHDIMVTFLIILAYLFILLIATKSRLKDYLLGGLISGLAVSANWNAILIIPSIFIANIFAIRNKGYKSYTFLFNPLLIMSGIMFLLGLFIGTPFMFLDFKTFLSSWGIGPQIQRILGIYQAKDGLGNSWIFFFRHSLFYAMGLPLLILSITGFLYILYKKTSIGMTLATFPVVYFLFFLKVGKATSDEYIIPVIPFFSLFASVILVDIISPIKLEPKIKIPMILFLVALLIFIPFKSILRHNYLLLKTDTRTLAKDWIEKNIPKYSKIALDQFVLIGPQTVPLVENKDEKQKRLLAILKDNPSKGRFTSALLELPYPAITYELIELTPTFHILKEYENYYDFKELKKRGVEYIVIHTFTPQKTFDCDYSFPKQCQFYLDVEKNGILIKDINPFKNDFIYNSEIGKYGRVSIYTPFDDVFIRERTGPRIRIFKIK